MSTKQIITKKLNVQAAESFLGTVVNDNAVYVFAAKHTPYGEISDDVIPNPRDSYVGSTVNVYDNMLFGKRVNDSLISLMVPRYDWQSNTTYAMYDDIDSDLYNKPFYACVNAGSFYHIYKCLYNNNGGPSTVEPTGTDRLVFETPEDNYIWKYIYSIPDTIMTKFGTSDHIPLVPNTNITTTDGSIEVIAIEAGGGGYDNYFTGSFESASDIRINGNPLLYGLGAGASSTDGLYKNCLMLMTSGSAKDEYRLVVDYNRQGNQRIVTLDRPFTDVVGLTDTYEIYPNVFVYDTSDTAQSNCVARAIVSPGTNSVSRIEILNAGSNYRSAEAVLIPDDVVGVTSPAELRPIMSPGNGHGSDLANEFGANFVGISVKFIKDETLIPTTNDYRTIGILKNPLFTNLTIKTVTNNTIGQFIVGERLLQYTPLLIGGNAEANATDVILVSDNPTIADSLRPGDNIILSDEISNVFATVVSTDSTEITLSDSVSFDGPVTVTLVRDIHSYGVISGVDNNILTTTAVPISAFSDSVYLIGEQSGCTSTIDVTEITESVTINDRYIDDFNKFNQMTFFEGQMEGEMLFVEDELIYQEGSSASTRPSANFHSLTNSGIYVTNVKNKFAPFQPESISEDGVVTANSGARFVMTNKYLGDLVRDSGEILYLENVNAILRSNTQTESIRLVIEF